MTERLGWQACYFATCVPADWHYFLSSSHYWDLFEVSPKPRMTASTSLFPYPGNIVLSCQNIEILVFADLFSEYLLPHKTISDKKNREKQ